MKRDAEELTGIQKLVQTCKAAFRIPENTENYSDEDFKVAERKFIKIACLRGTIPMGDTTHDHAAANGDTLS
jgi:hypothetical protein